MSGAWGTTKGARSAERARILGGEEGAGLDVVLGVVLGMVLAASLAAAWRFVRTPRRVLDPGGAAMQRAVHAATTILPHLRRGLTGESAKSATPALRVLTGADAVALAGHDELLAYEGAGADHHRAGDPLESLVPARREERLHVEPRVGCPEPGCPLRSAIVAPLAVRDRRIGVLVALYERPGRVRLEESRVVAEAAALVSAMVELSELEAQGERLARAELRALRAQISPHFIYNALAAVAAFIHSRPEEARELLIEFSEFIRYAFARQRPYVTLADELQYVEKYLRLEQARFGERLRVRVQVDPGVLQAVLPVLSLQPLVENAVRHGVESRAEGGLVSIEGRDLGTDIELRVSDDGAGIDPERAAEALAGNGPGIGLGNVHGRLQSTFGEGYGLMVENGAGTTVVMTLPKFRAGVRAG
jgi:two-component system LytT family sensor kinase